MESSLAERRPGMSKAHDRRSTAIDFTESVYLNAPGSSILAKTKAPHPQSRVLRPITKNCLQRCLACGFDFRPTSAGRRGQTRPACCGKLAFALRGRCGWGSGLLNSCPAGALRGAHSGDPGGADLLPLRCSGGVNGRRSRSAKELGELTLKGINALFDICCPTQLSRC